MSSSSAREPVRVGQYRLIQRLGEGGMGVVHLALDPAGRAVAVKVLRPHIAADPDARRRLAREVAALRRVRHPRVAAVIDADVECEVPYLVTNFVPGKPLDEHVKDHGPLPRGHVARVGSVLADALRAIHASGIVHRDVKPANVMLLDGEPILIDFGIAHDADESRITHTGLVMGTPGYLSPEIIGGDPVSAATDWWGWGATLAFAATGRPPFGTGPIEVVLDRVRRGQSDIEGVDAGLRATLTAALAIDPARRPSPDRLVAGLAAVAPPRNGLRSGPQAPTIDLSSHEAATAKTPPPSEAVTTRTPPPHEAQTTRTPPPRESRTTRSPAPVAMGAGPAAASGAASAAEAITAVVPPPASWSNPALPDTRRFDAPNGRRDRNDYLAPNGSPSPNGYTAPSGSPSPSGVPAPNGYLDPNGYPAPNGYQQPARSGPANGFTPPPAPPNQQRPNQQRANQQRPNQSGPNQPGQGAQRRPQPDEAPARAPYTGDASRGVLLGVLAVLAALAAIAPYGATWIAALGMLAARVIDRSTTALLQRRDQRGPRGSDAVVTLMALPWRLISAGLATVFALILPILVGISVTFIAASAYAGAPTRAIPGQPGPLALGMAALLLTAWWGPGGGSVRRGAVKGARLVCPGPRARIIVWSVLVLALISALTVGHTGDGPDWGPLKTSKIVNMLSTG